jgi:hypothetical protein
MIRNVWMVTAMALAGSACATPDGPDTRTPGSFVGEPLMALVAAYGAPVEAGMSSDGARVASFLVTERLQPVPQTPRASYAPNRSGQLRPDRPRFAGGTPPGRSGTRRCAIQARYGADEIVFAIDTAPSGCARLSPV